MLKDESGKIDAHMSDTNIGGRKGRRIQDHLFIVNGVIFEHARTKKSKSISISIYDNRQCFDSLCQSYIMNDLFQAGMNNDKLSLLWKINQVNKLAVKTSQGLSQRKEVNKIVCQGDPWGTIECSLHMEDISKDSLKPELEPYKYKDELEIPALLMVDDLITITESGYKSTRMNAFVNAKIATKKLQFGAEKCFVIHIGSEHEEYKNVELCVDGWVVKTVENFQTGQDVCEDTLDEDIELSHIEAEKYLGQIISSDSKNTKNILKMKNKGIGIQNKLIQMLQTMPGGQYHFQIAVIYCNAYLISSILASSEVWYGVTQVEYEQLESVDEIWMKNLFQCSSCVAVDLLYLELGVWPIRHIIMKRRCLYLHHILQQKEDSTLFKFFLTQLKNPRQGDWVSQVLSDLEKLEIHIELEQIQRMSENKYNQLLTKQINKEAFNWLLEKKMSRKSANAKGKYLFYSELKMADYLAPSDIEASIEEKKWLFKCKVEDIDVKCNRRWQNEITICQSCNENTEETQCHILFCKNLIGKNELLTYIPSYSELFGTDIQGQIYTSRLIKDNHERRIV